MFVFVTVLIIIVAILLAIVVLVQNSKGGGSKSSNGSKKDCRRIGKSNMDACRRVVGFVSCGNSFHTRQNSC